MQQLISELKVDKGRYVKDRKFYEKVRGQKVQWQRKLQFIVKEGEDVAGATESSQDLTREVIKTCKYVR